MCAVFFSFFLTGCTFTPDIFFCNSSACLRGAAPERSTFTAGYYMTFIRNPLNRFRKITKYYKNTLINNNDPLLIKYMYSCTCYTLSTKVCIQLAKWGLFGKWGHFDHLRMRLEYVVVCLCVCAMEAQAKAEDQFSLRMESSWGSFHGLWPWTLTFSWR